MSGDQLNVSVDYFYTATNADNSGASGLNSFINNLASVINGSDAVSQGLKSASSTIVSGLSTSSTVSTFFAPENASTGGTNAPPKAYLHVLLFDERFGFDNTNSFVQQVSYSPNTAGTITKALLNVVKSGYAYIYFSNESNEMVYFDNFKLSQVRGPLLEETHYYPFGLTMAGISSKSAGKLENKFKYNGKELQSKEFSDGSGLELYDYGARMYDAQIGKWHTPDPMSMEMLSVSPYTYTFDNPVNHIDEDGMIPIPLWGYFGVNKRDYPNGLPNAIVRTSTYWEIRNVGTSPHIGIDYRAKIGTPIYSMGKGIVDKIYTTKSGIKILQVEYRNGDKVRFLHLSKYATGLQEGATVLEGQVIGFTGNSGKYDNGKKQYPAHLHVDAKDKDGNSVNPENRDYGDYTNQEFFEEYGGDYNKLPSNGGSEEQNTNFDFFDPIRNFFRGLFERAEWIHNEFMKIKEEVDKRKEYDDKLKKKNNASN